MKTMLKSLAAIRTWMVALAVTFLSGATLAASLPEGYTEVEYIESSGTQWVDTKVLGNAGLEAELDLVILNLLDKNKDSGVLDSRNGTNGRFYFLHLGTNNTKGFYGYGSNNTQTWSYETMRRYQVESILHAGEQKLIVDGETVKSGTDATELKTGYNLYFFAINEAGKPNWYSCVRLYRAVIKQNGTILADFVPCRTAEGEYGFYDVQRGGFYGNGATGAPLTGGTAVSVSDDTLTVNETNGDAFLCDSTALIRNPSLVLKSGEVTLPMLEEASVATFPAATLEGGTLGFSGGVAGPGQYRVTGALSVTGRVTLNVPPALAAGTYRLVEAGSLSIAEDAGFELAATAGVVPAKRTLSVDATGVTLTVEGAPKLPAGYTQVNYLESTGLEWIDTGVEVGQHTAVEMDFGNITYVNKRALFGQDSWTSNRYMLDIQSNKFMFHGDNKDIKDSSGNLVPVDGTAQYRVLVADDDALHLTVNGTCVANVAVSRATSAANKNLAVFGLNNATQQTGFRCYGLRIADNGRLVRDFVPARNYRGELGLYDRVTGGFRGNQGSGRFVGPDETAMRLSWIQSNNNQYIDTGVIGKPGLTVTADFAVMSDTGNDCILVGSRQASNTDTRFYPIGNDLTKFRFIYAKTWQYPGSTFTIGQRYLVESSVESTKQELKVNGTSVLTKELTNVPTTTYNMFLFEGNVAGKRSSWGGYIRLWGSTITVGDDLVRDFVPARSADGYIGLIDLANGGEFYPNKETTPFAWGGIAYNIDGTTLKLHEGTLAAEDIAGYMAVEKVDWHELNAGAVTAYAMPLTLSKGVFALTDDEVKTVSVAGKLTLKGGVVLKVDAIGTECDNFEAQSLDLTDATEENPIIVEIVSAVGMDWSAGATLIANTGLADGPCANVRIADNDELVPVIKNGNLTIQMKSAAAHWTGAVDNDPTKPQNWEEGTVPTAETIVYISGEMVPDFLSGTTFAAKSLELSVTLADDYDWRGLDPAIPVTGKIDLNGHSLTVANLTGDYEITDTTDTSADDATPGELHVDVESGKTIENIPVIISGALKFVKEGDGTFIVRKERTYTGGTDVKGGTLKCGDNIYPGALPADTVPASPLTVYEGAVFDVGLLHKWNAGIVLAGGTFANRHADFAFGDKAQNAAIRVVADSAIDAQYSFSIVNVGYGVSSLDLGGKELTISIAKSKSFGFCNTDITAGTIKTTGEGTLLIQRATVRAAETDFDLGCSVVTVDSATEVKDLTVRSGTTVSGSSVITVNGAYRPLGATAPKVALKDGASFDLSTLDSAFDLAGTTTTYEDNATILINVGDRELETDEKVIAWSAKPANVGGLTFKFVGTKLDGETVNAIVQDDGIYYPDVKTIVKATWTGAAGDGNVANPANWSCENALGGKVTGDDALPGARTVVQLDGEIAFNVPSGAPFTAGSVNANASLKGDTDWSGLDTSIPISGTIDLKGHKLTVANLVGNYEITDSSAEVYEQLEYIQSNGSQYIDTGVLGNMGLEAELDMLFPNAPSDETFPLASRRTTSSNDRFYFVYAYGVKIGYRLGNASAVQPFSVTANTRYLFRSVLAENELSFAVNGEVKTITTTGITSVNTDKNLFLFACNKGGSADWYSSSRLYGAKISGGGKILRDFVPAKRVSDGAIGLLDLAHLGSTDPNNPEFYENKGSTAFTAGAKTGYIVDKPGEFHINVVSGTIKNTAVTLTGSVRVVKEGEGTLELGTIKQSNAGGWEITEGTVKASGNLHTYTSFGLEGTTVTVREGATYDLNGQPDSRYYPFVLDGGTIANKGGNVGATSGCMGKITLTKDSYLNPAASFPIWDKVDLGGFKLTVDVGTSRSFYLYGDGIFENGTVDIRTGGWLTSSTLTSGDLRDMRTIDFTLNAALNLTTSIAVRDLTVLYDQNYKDGSGTANIYGVFTPSAKNYIHNFVMQDGSTLNLAGRDGIYDLTSSVVTGNSNVLGFADGATITVIPNKSVGKIVAWDAMPENVTFVVPKGIGKLEVKTDGLYLHRGLVFIIQ